MTQMRVGCESKLGILPSVDKQLLIKLMTERSELTQMRGRLFFNK
ncbi:hypothetical protein VCSRO19_0576 [Vibrio cholerae]|nr:hypothetical protein VCSRO19_0576 [Vibrio cholerae]